MNTAVVEKIANAVLYEGYLLYPYRQSALKNHQRFNFGVLYPREYCERQAGTEAWWTKTECLVTAKGSVVIEAKVRFLNLVNCGVRQEGREREVLLSPCTLESLASTPLCQPFGFDDSLGALEVAAVSLGPELFRVRLTIRNLTQMSGVCTSRDEVLLRSFVSVHTILRVAGGEFVSLLDPPECWTSAASACQNVGSWPVLVGDAGQKDTMLSAPIILYDYPQIAPESPGDLFDSTEIDEILALRILTMTDAEKQEVMAGDDRARRILERTEMLPPEHFQKLHGALRGLTETRPGGGL